MNRKLNQVKACLVRAFEPYELISVLLQNDLRTLEPGEQIKISDLAQMARETFLEIHKGDNLDQPDPRFSAESFQNDVFFALSAAQRKLVELYREKKGDNDEGYMLVISDDQVRWEKCPERIERFISEEIEALAARHA